MLLIKRKVVLSLILVLVISSSVFGSYWFIKNRQKGSADTFEDAEEALKARYMGASFCNDVNNPDIHCEVEREIDKPNIGFYFNILDAVKDTANLITFPGLDDMCFYQFNQKYTPINLPKSPIVIKIPGIFEGSYCIYNLNKKILGGYHGTIIFKTDATVSNGLPKVYKNSVYVSDSGAKLDLKYDTYQTREYKFVYKNKKWTKHFLKETENRGNVDAPVTMMVNSTEQHPLKNIDSSIQIDEARSSWQTKIQGVLRAKLKGNWDSSKTPEKKIEELKFCSNKDDCIIEVEEKLRLFAQKQSSDFDSTSGSIESQATHKEIFSGTGEAAKDGQGQYTGGVRWKDLIVDKSDQRYWAHDLTYTQDSRLVFSANQISTAHIEPLKKFEESKTEYFKNFVLNTPFTAAGGPDSTLLTEINADFKVKNNNQTITREGRGIIRKTVNGPHGSYELENIVGYYDDIDDLLRIDLPANRFGERIDLWSGIDSKYFKTYFPSGTSYVSGYFTSTDGNAQKTIISTPPYKGIPKYVIYLKSFNKADTRSRKEMIAKVDSFVKELKNRGAIVSTFQTTSRKAMISAFNQMPNDSLVINLGHGGEDGLYASDELVRYYELRNILQFNQVKLSTFAGDSCYAARGFTNLAGDIVSSFGLGYTVGETDGFGSLFGFADNYWNSSSQDIIDKLSQITGCST